MLKNKNETMPFAEFVALMALFVALMAMAIDTILPALAIIGQEFGIVNENETQFIIGILFLGFTFGQIIYGPLSDSFGRKPTIYIGLFILVIGDILSLCAKDFNMMLLGRFLQGFGAASPRVVSMAVIRDMYKGRDMARVTSFIMTVFIIIPVIAPSIGQLILIFFNWRVMFFIFLFAAAVALFLTYFRLPETLKKENVKPFNLKTIWKDFCLVVTNKITMGYTICAGLIFGALIGYLISSRQIFQEYFNLGKLFPLFFAISALSIGAASIVNSMIVRRLGMKLICHYSLLTMIISSALFCALYIFTGGQIAVWQFMVYIMIAFFCLGLLFGNLNALAMEFMGEYAGMASAVIGSLSSAISVVIGTVIGQAYNNTLIPIMVGFLSLAIISFIIQHRLAKNV